MIIVLALDILTPLPALGVDFQIIPGKGPHIPTPIRSAADVDGIGDLYDPDRQLPFIAPILKVQLLL